MEAVIRPESLRLRLDGGGPGVVRRTTYFGHDQLVEVELDGLGIIHSRIGPARLFEPGDRVSVAVSGEVVAFPAGAVAEAPADPW